MATRNFVPRGDGEGSIGTTVKNWAGGFFQKLAVGAITTAVTVLTPAADANNQQPATTGWVRSQFQSILKTVLSAAGLKYNIAQNGYICFGALFGGLILQWGNVNVSVESSQLFTIITPIKRTNWEILGACMSAREYLSIDNMDDVNSIHLISSNNSLNEINLLISTPKTGNNARGWWKWIILCY